MKKLFVMAAAALMFAACSRDEVPESGGTTSGKTQEVEITFGLNVSTGMETRAGRQLYSQEALQKVTDVKVLVFKDNKYDQTITVPGFDKTTVKGDEEHSYMFSQKLGVGTYTFLAIGRDDDSAENTGVYENLSLVQGTTERSGLLLALKDNKHAAEIFVGTEDSETVYKVDENTKKLNVSIEMRRAVAGIVGYFTNIPYILPHPESGDDAVVNKVCVELVAKGTKANLVSRTANEQSRTAEYYKLLTIDLTSINGAHQHDSRNIWARDAQTTPITIKENSFLKGGYSLPISLITGVETMRVVLYGANNVALKTFKVKCEGTQDGNETNHTKGSVFNIYANHFYALGKKMEDQHKEPDPNKPDEDPKPTPDPEDDPIDLSNEDVITVKVYTGWDRIHNLGLE